MYNLQIRSSLGVSRFYKPIVIVFLLCFLQPVFCSGYLKFAESGPNKGQFLGIVALCKLASVARVKEMCVGAFFKTKHSLDLSYTNIDTRYVHTCKHLHSYLILCTLNYIIVTFLSTYRE